MRISDWSSDVCSSDLVEHAAGQVARGLEHQMLEQLRKAAASGRVVALADIVPDVDGYRGRGGIGNCVESGSIVENGLRELKLRDSEQSGRRRFGLGTGRREGQGADGKKKPGGEARERQHQKFGDRAWVREYT